MINRWLVFFACLLAGGGLGFLAASKQGLVAGIFLAAFVWLLVDSFYVARFLAWLRSAQNSESASAASHLPPSLPGLWGEAAERIRRHVSNTFLCLLLLATTLLQLPLICSD